MKRVLFAWVIFFSATAMAATGSFVGQVVNGPNVDGKRKWVYVQGANGAARKVDISAARVSFSADAKGKNNASEAAAAIRDGVEVRVTASQDAQGEWKAHSVEILKLP